MEEGTEGSIIQFLCGSHSYGGRWFGDKVDGKPFWWRPILAEYFKQQIINARISVTGLNHQSPTDDNAIEEAEEYFTNTFKQ